MQKNNSQTLILVVLLIVASFFLGVLTTKVQYLEKGPSNQPQNAGAPTGSQNPPAPSSAPAKVDVSVGHFPLKGNNNAKVTIVEFGDFRCPFCNQFFTTTQPQIMKDYVDTGKAKFAFRQYAFLGPASTVAANAAECANDQGKFWDFHDYLYKNQPQESDTSMYNTATLTQAAVTLGMNGDQFKSCLDNKQDDSKATADFTDGQKAGVTGTPAFFINGVLLVGAQPYSAFQTAIDQALKK